MDDQNNDLESIELGAKSAKIASLVAIAQVASIITGGLMLVLLARLLGPTQYGIYTLAYGVSTFFGAFGISGIGHYLNKYIPLLSARKKKLELENQLGASFLALLLICAGAAIVGALFSGLISNYVFHGPGYVLLIDVALLSMIPMLLMYLAYNALIGFKDGIGSSATFTLGNLAIMLVSVLLVILGYGAMGAIVGIIIGSLIGLAIGIWYITRHSRMRFDFSKIYNGMGSVMQFSLPLAGATVVPVLLNSFSILLLGAFSSAIIIGSFGVAYRIGTIVGIAIAFVGSVLVQMFATALENKKLNQKIEKMYNYSIYFGSVVAVPVAIYLIIMSRPFVDSLFPAFRSSLLYTPAVVFSTLIGIIGIYASSLMISMGKVKEVFYYTLLTGVVQLVLLLALVPLLNAYGVILGVYFTGSVVSDYLFMRYMKKKLNIQTELGKVYKMLLASVVLAVALLPILLLPISETAQLFVGMAVVVVVYPILLGVSGAMERQDIKLVKAVAGSIPLLGGVMDAFTSYISFFSR